MRYARRSTNRRVRWPRALRSPCASACRLRRRSRPRRCPCRRRTGRDRADADSEGRRHRSETRQRRARSTRTFVDETGRDVTLGDYFGTQPVVLVLVYYQLPDALHAGAERAGRLARGADASTPGKDFDVVVVSFDPGETPAMAAEEARRLRQALRPAGRRGGMHFLTGREADDRRAHERGRLPVHVRPGDRSVRAPGAHHRAHADGRVSRYLYGIEFAPRDLQAGAGRGGGQPDRHGRRSAAALLLPLRSGDREIRPRHHEPVRLGGVLTVGGLGAFILLSLRRERRQAQRGPADRNGYSLDVDLFSAVSAQRVVGRDRDGPAVPVHHGRQRVLRRARRGAGRDLHDQVPAPRIPTRSARTSTARSCSS